MSIKPVHFTGQHGQISPRNWTQPLLTLTDNVGLRQRILRKSAKSATTDKPTTSVKGKKELQDLRVLLVDDNTVNLKLAERLLVHSGADGTSSYKVYGPNVMLFTL